MKNSYYSVGNSLIAFLLNLPVSQLFTGQIVSGAGSGKGTPWKDIYDFSIGRVCRAECRYNCSSTGFVELEEQAVVTEAISTVTGKTKITGTRSEEINQEFLLKQNYPHLFSGSGEIADQIKKANFNQTENIYHV